VKPGLGVVAFLALGAAVLAGAAIMKRTKMKEKKGGRKGYSAVQSLPTQGSAAG
jgi:hypothetical protein